MKKIIAIILTVVLLTALPVSAVAYNISETVINATIDEIEKTIYLSDEGYVYPDWYGGIEVTDNNLTVSIAKKYDIPDFIEKNPFITINEVEYSRNELQSIVDEYVLNMDTFYSYYVDESINKAVIMTDLNTISEFEDEIEMLNLPIILKEGKKVELCTTVVRGSKMLYNNTAGFYFSSGVAAVDKYGAKYIISCGHGMSVKDTISYNGTIIGKVTSVRYGNNKYGDYSLIRLNSDIDISTLVAIGDTADNINYAGDLSWVNGDGKGVLQGGRTGYSKFYLSQTNVSCFSEEDKITIQGLSMGFLHPDYENNALPGDSGSPIYYRDGQNLVFAGILSGHCAEKEDDLKYIVFTPYSFLPTSLQIYTVDYLESIY